VSLLESIPKTFEYDVFRAKEILFDEKKQTYVNDKDSDVYEENVDVIPNGSSSVYSGSVSQEVDVVDIYKKKIQNNIYLKQKNLKIIKILFVFSLFCYIALAISLDVSFTSIGSFTFKESYIIGIVNLQSIVSKLLSVAFIAHFNHMFINNTDTTPFGNATFKIVQPTYTFSSSIQVHFTDVSSSIDNFLQIDPQSYLVQENAIKSFMYTWSDWNVDNSTTSSMTFFNYLKSMSVTLSSDTLYDPVKFQSSPLYFNVENMITKLYDLEDQVTAEFDESYQYMASFLFYFILVRQAYKRTFLPVYQPRDHRLLDQGAQKLEFDLHSLLENPERADFLL
jgi:hypothetical protein